MMFIMEECNLLGLGTGKKEKQKQNPKAPHPHCHQNGTKETISSLKLMPSRLPSHTIESAPVPTLVCINSFLSLYLQPKSNPNQTGIKTKLDNRVKTSSKTALHYL